MKSWLVPLVFKNGKKVDWDYICEHGSFYAKDPFKNGGDHSNIEPVLLDVICRPCYKQDSNGLELYEGDWISFYTIKQDFQYHSGDNIPLSALDVPEFLGAVIKKVFHKIILREGVYGIETGDIHMPLLELNYLPMKFESIVYELEPRHGEDWEKFELQGDILELVKSAGFETMDDLVKATIPVRLGNAADAAFMAKFKQEHKGIFE